MKKRKQKKKRIRKPKFTIRFNKENNQWKLGGEKAKIIGGMSATMFRRLNSEET